MTNRYSLFTCFILPWFLLMSGCEQQHKEDILAIAPDISMMTLPGDYAMRAIDAAGGLQNWTKIDTLEFDCVVTLFEPPAATPRQRGEQGSFYLTEHHYEIYPWSNSIRISAQEPSGKFVWQLSSGQFRMLEGDKRNDISPVVSLGEAEPRWTEFYPPNVRRINRDYAEAVLSIITAPALFLDSKALFTKATTTGKIAGVWYQPIQRTIRSPAKKESAKPIESSPLGGSQPYWSKVTLYQNAETSLVDTIWFADFSQKKFLLVRGYDYSKLHKDEILVPTKIEIFRTDSRGFVPQRLAEINFK